MPHALLLSPDDQAVSAITGVLEEMSVTCERPLDGMSAAQKLNSQSFDLVLVDCENLPAAKLIFDVCRRGKNGNHPVPIAIVDGRAGLPTAFRLGAELILTKPVAKDQARTTIRAAVGRVRKDAPANEIANAASNVADTDVTVPAIASAAVAEPRAQAAAASASSLLTSYDDPAPSFTSNSIAKSISDSSNASAGVAGEIAGEDGSPSALSAAAATPRIQSPLEELGPLPSLRKPKEQAAFFAPQSSPASRAAAAVLDSNPPRTPEPSDDPVLAELERTEKQELEEAAALEVPSLAKPIKSDPATSATAPVLSSYQQGPKKTSASLIALLLMVLAIGGFYGAWTYQPGFREMAQPEIDRLLGLVGMAHPTQTATAPATVKPPIKPAPAPLPAASTDPNQPQPNSAAPSTTADATAGLVNGSPAATASTLPPAQSPQTAPNTAATPAPTSTTATAVAAKVDASKADPSKPADATKADSTKKDSASSTPASAELPGESTAIILSSKGAEKRLARSVQPKYPAEARANGSDGTVVLKEVVDETGKVAGVRLVEGNDALASAAIDAVKQWRYRPYVRDGKTMSFQTVVIVDFQRP